VKRIIGGALLLALAGGYAGMSPFVARAMAGPAELPPSPPPPPEPNLSGDAIAFHVNGKPIKMSELVKPLVEGYGLNVLLHAAQLNMAEQKAAEQKVKVTQADVDAELDRTLKSAFQDAPKEDYPELLNQLLTKQGFSRPEFDMVMRVNAILRKIAEPQIVGKVTDGMVREEFNAVYGETAVIKHIQCANLQETSKVLSRLAAGDKFEDLVHTASRNGVTPSADGTLPRFSRQTESWSVPLGTLPPKVPEGFKAFAFDPKVKPGDVSDPIQAGDGFHILKMVSRNSPKIVDFEKVKEKLRTDLEQQIVERGITQLRGQLAQMVRATLKIDDPNLNWQFEQRRAHARDAEKKARGEIESNIKSANEPAATGGKDLSGTPAAGGAVATSPTDASTGERPPATKSAAPGAADSKSPTLNK